MAFSTTSSGPSNPEMNVTPLIDVALVLIIVFMIVGQEKHNGLEAQIPERPQGRVQSPPGRTLVIQIFAATDDQTPTLRINQENVKWEDLKARLHGIFKLRAERVAFVRGDDEVDFQYVAGVIDIARSAGVERIGLLGNQSAVEGK